SRYLPGLLETLNLQALLDQLADFLLQSGFAGGPYSHPFWGEFGEDDPDRSLDALRQAILQALMDSGQLTPTCSTCCAATPQATRRRTPSSRSSLPICSIRSCRS